MKNYSEDANRQYHIQTAEGEVGRYVILPGDPGRCEKIAQYLDHPVKIAENREFVTYTGELCGEKVSVTSTGIGGPSAAIAMEEEKANGADIDGQAISAIKTSLMGPLAGIGDTLRQGTLIPIIGSIAIALGQAGNLFAPIFYMLATLALNWGISHTLFMKVYDKGTAFVAEFFQGNRMEKIMTIITTMGSVTIGALAANTVKLSTPLELTLGEKVLNIQADILDSVILNLLPFCAVMLVFWLIGKKKVSINKVIIGIFVVGIVGGLIGIL